MNTYKQSLYTFGAPAVLLIIACLQIYLAQVYQLSQWKGGGFGMFSTIDSPGARFLRLYLQTNNGSFPVEVPDSMKAVAREIQTFPTQSRLCSLTGQLYQSSWVPYAYDPFGKHINASSRNSSAPSDDSPFIDDGTPSVPLSQVAGEQPADMVTMGEHPLLRILAINEPPPSNPIVIDSIRVELWRFSFNVQNLRIEAKKYSECSIKSKESNRK